MASSLMISTRYFFKRINTNSSQTCLRYKEGTFLYSVRPVLFENQNQAKTSYKKKTTGPGGFKGELFQTHKKLLKLF